MRKSVNYQSCVAETLRLAGIYTGWILKGDKPANLPVQQATKVELYINLKTAKALGLLVDRIAGLANVEVVTQAQVSALEGKDGMLQALRWRQGAAGKETRRPIRHLFLFIGAEPNTGWLTRSGVVLRPEGIRARSHPAE